jgi:hypothetical protein
LQFLRDACTLIIIKLPSSFQAMQSSGTGVVLVTRRSL